MWALRTSGRYKCPCSPSLGYVSARAQVWAYFNFSVLFYCIFIIFGSPCLTFVFSWTPGPSQFLARREARGIRIPRTHSGSPVMTRQKMLHEKTQMVYFPGSVLRHTLFPLVTSGYFIQWPLAMSIAHCSDIRRWRQAIISNRRSAYSLLCSDVVA